MTLGLSGSALVARIARLRTANDMPIALEQTSLPDDILPNPDIVENSLYQVLSQRDIRPVRANQRISAALLRDEETELLGVPLARPHCAFSVSPISPRVGSWKSRPLFIAATPMTSLPN